MGTSGITEKILIAGVSFRHLIVKIGQMSEIQEILAQFGYFWPLSG